MVDGYWEVPGREFAAFIMKHLQRSPFARQNQFSKAVVVQVAPDSAADQANLLQQTAVLRIQLELLPIAAIDPRAGGLRVTAGNHAAADKQIEVAISIQICQCQRPGARFATWQTVVQDPTG